MRQTVFAAFLAIACVQGARSQVQTHNHATVGSASKAGAVVAMPPASADKQSQKLAQPGTAESEDAALTPEEARQSAKGNVAELQQLIQALQVAELRTTYNGGYAASLLFDGRNLTYYVALLQQQNFWRAIRTQDAARAELIYRDFARQTVQLSEVEIQRIQLEAQKAFNERMIAQAQSRADQLQADLDVARQQQANVADQQRQTRAEAAALAEESAAAQERLRAAQRQVMDLQRQLDTGLPTR